MSNCVMLSRLFVWNALIGYKLIVLRGTATHVENGTRKTLFRPNAECLRYPYESDLGRGRLSIPQFQRVGSPMAASSRPPPIFSFDFRATICAGKLFT